CPGARMPVIHGYEILEELGRGGMGIVYKARQLELDRIVALKLVRTGLDADNHDRHRFRTEMLAVARLDHPGVVRIHFPGDYEGQLYFCMEYLSGGNLSGKLRQSGGKLGVDESARLVEQLARAVSAAHRARVLHRDLKPANVLLDGEGKAKISDFGLAKLQDRDDGQTASEIVLGTPADMAPEQAAGLTGTIGP